MAADGAGASPEAAVGAVTPADARPGGLAIVAVAVAVAAKTARDKEHENGMCLQEVEVTGHRMEGRGRRPT